MLKIAKQQKKGERFLHYFKIIIMEYICESNGYQLHRNKDGFIEAYRKTGKKIVNGQDIGNDLSHVVTNCRTVQEFDELFNANKARQKPKSSLPPQEQPKLFNDEQ